MGEYIAYSPEHNDIFPGTVHDGIQYGNLNATEDEILNAGELAGITTHREEFLQRNIGENGEQLSGGQKQKPTAALDADSESKILNTILKLKQEGKYLSNIDGSLFWQGVKKLL